jgi:hypothetical protein
MLLRATLELPIPAATAAERLSPLLRPSGLDKLSDDAYQEGMATLARVGPFGDSRGLSKTVRVVTLDPRSVGGGIRIPFRWVATGRTGNWFPALDADLDVIPVDDERCNLSINAAYTPPLGPTGAGLDRLLLHRAARATMRSLLRGLARTVLDGDAVAGALREQADGADGPRSLSARLGEVTFFPDAPLAPPAEA